MFFGRLFGDGCKQLPAKRCGPLRRLEIEELSMLYFVSKAIRVFGQLLRENASWDKGFPPKLSCDPANIWAEMRKTRRDIYFLIF